MLVTYRLPCVHGGVCCRPDVLAVALLSDSPSTVVIDELPYLMGDAQSCNGSAGTGTPGMARR